jgi:Zn-dependent protease with chaperone function
MDFFEHQDLARKNSRKLVFLFVLALIGVVVSVYVLISVLYFAGTNYVAEAPDGLPPIDPFTDWRLMLAIGGGTLLFVGGASAYRVASLSGGGQVVASSLGGRPLQPDTRDFDERRLLNVVEEMAIASGIPVPPVFLLEEQGINAFAAGYSPQDAVIGVTRGCVETLTRDELQGVIAHEFSHILNGDMRLNIRMIGVVYGVMAIGYIGWQIFRLSMYSGGSRRNGKDNKGGLLALAGGLILIGAVGTFFGNWIKASLSRQREYLADASAVQFTRNPQGIAGALKQIGASPVHGEISSPNASEFSHMYFATGVTGFFAAIFSTHPPLEKRIQRIDPRWDGKFPTEQRARKLPEPAARTGQDRADSMKQKVAKAIPILMGVEAIGQPTPSHLELAHQLIADIPEPVKQAARNPYGARAVLYALMLNHEPEIQRTQLKQLDQFAERGLAEMTGALAVEVSKLDRQHRLPLAEMTLGSLKMLSTTQFNNFMANLDVLVKADSKIELFEWVVLRIVKQHLGPPQRSRAKYHRLEKLTEPCNLLISSLAWSGHHDPAEVKSAFESGSAAINIPGLSLVPRERISLSKLGQALDKLEHADMDAKKKLITACAKCITADKQVTNNEAELMRAIAESFGCPMPPLIPDQSLA